MPVASSQASTSTVRAIIVSVPVNIASRPVPLKQRVRPSPMTAAGLDEALTNCGALRDRAASEVQAL
ncbi:hypothetical protein ACIPN8_31255 [Streptomyces sp. NPDC086082]|uniref:hypothetical protein n=1 Tax=Streptomyces sp. NPDC086082 TaxID=3365750 RepID=UPI00381E1982